MKESKGLLINNGCLDGMGTCSDKDIVIPSGVTRIEVEAFGQHEELKSVFIPASVKEIGADAFWDCCGLESIIVDKANPVYNSGDNANAIIETDINELIVGCCNTLIPDNVIYIGVRAFYQCKNLKKINIPASVRIIGGGAFYRCHDLLSVNIPASVVNIGDFAFRDCCNLESIVIDKGNQLYNSKDNANAIIETATGDLITGCNNTVIPDNVRTIKASAFLECRGLEKIDLNKVEIVEDCAFRECTGLKELTITDSVKEIGEYAFQKCTALTSVKIPSSLSKIPLGMFFECFSLKDVSLSDSLEEICDGAFQQCGKLEQIELPKSIKCLGEQIFYGCNSLKAIKFRGTVSEFKSLAEGISLGYDLPVDSVKCVDGEYKI